MGMPSQFFENIPVLNYEFAPFLNSILFVSHKMHYTFRIFKHEMKQVANVCKMADIIRKFVIFTFRIVLNPLIIR